MSGMIDWIIGWFVESDLVDLNLTDAQRCESAQYDSMATDTVNREQDDDSVPIGKRVL